ncbi:MAG: hypothetical protein QOI63_1189 [Thermoplasmata archaeon]|jgi:hypothetical protein|nr:hypothetical protein [Thermoplasmata archaeon]
MASWVRGSWWAGALAALLLLSTLAQAAAPIGVDASHLDVVGGDTMARFAGAAFEKQGCSGLTVTGTAQHVRIEVEGSYQDTTLGEAPTGTSHLDRQDFEANDTLLTLTDPTPGCRVAAWADPGAEATFAFPRGNRSLAPAPALATDYQSHGNLDRHFSIGGPNLLRTTGDAGFTQVAGALRMDVWEATLDVHSPSENRTFHMALGSVTRPNPNPPAQLPIFFQNGEVEALVWLGGAHLTWTLPTTAEVLASAAHVEAPAGRAELSDATLVSSGATVRGPALVIEAPRGDLHATGDHLQGTFESVPAAAPGGRTAFAAAHGAPAWTLWAAGALLVSAVGGRRWAVVGMRNAMDADDCERAARLALAVWPATAESRVARVVCLLRLGRFDAAARALRPQRWRAQQATRSFLQARLEASRGDAAAARRHLAECFLLSPAFVADARADLALHGIVEAALGRLQDLHREGYA